MKSLLPNPYLLAVGVSLLAYILIWIARLILTTKVAKLIGRPQNKWDDYVVYIMEKTTQFFMIFSALYVGFKFIPHKKVYNVYADRLFFIIVMWQIAVWTHYLLNLWITSVVSKKVRRNRAAASSVSLIQLFARFVVFSVIFLFTLSNLGIKITTIIAGLGVGGIAIALALQKILGDLFSSLSIVLDKPFMVGDFIVIDQYLGEVEKIGLKTTRIRSLSGEQIIFSNSDLLGTRIRNYKRMHERRIVFLLHLQMNISTEKLRNAVSIISSIIRTKQRVRFERCHFMKINHASLDVETVYWVLSDDYDLYMDIQQDILFDIKNAFESEGIVFTYPTQTLQVMPTEVVMRQELDFSKQGNKPVDSIVS